MTVRFTFLLLTTLFFAGCSEKLYYQNIGSQEKCDCKKEAYWFNDKCWKNFEDETISVSDIDSVVNAEIIQSKSALISVGDQTHPIDVFFPIPEDKVFIILTEYTDAQGRKSMISEVPMKAMRKNEIEADVLVLNGSIMQGEFDTIPHASGSVMFNISEEEDEISALGYFVEMNQTDSTQFSYSGSESRCGLGD